MRGFVKVKICGITNEKDALLACNAGADALGFVFYERSSRYIDPVQAGSIIKKLPPFITTVGVFVNQDYAYVKHVGGVAGIDLFQLHGDETPEFCLRFGNSAIKAFSVKDHATITGLSEFKVSAYLLDTFQEGIAGGTGKVFNWNLAGEAKKFGRIILAGGLSPENVKEAVRKVQPYAVDVSSGVESEPGKKDEEKVRAFIHKAKDESFT
ncbi:MAG: phosphoribosylanthranilate isomerase [Thermodesulfobacteriota bacterium]